MSIYQVDLMLALIQIKYSSQLFKIWIALSTGQITIQWISVRETNWVIHWIEIYPVDSAIQLLNNWGLEIIGNHMSFNNVSGLTLKRKIEREISFSK